MKQSELITIQELKAKLMKKPSFRKAYKALEPEFKLINSLIEQRIKQELTQEALAKKVGTKQSAISRFESFSSEPRLGFLTKVATALGARVVIEPTKK